MSTPPDRTTALDRYQASVVAPPAPDEWRNLVEMAKTISATEFVPTSYRGNPNQILGCFLTARGLGLDLMQGLRQIVMVNGRPTFQAELMVALVRRAGHSILPVDDASNETVQTVRGIRRDTDEEMIADFSLEDAARANLLNNPQKPAWTTYPDAMLWARAVSKLCRRLFPDVLLGITYTPEELGANVDAGGNVLGERTHVVVEATEEDGTPVEAVVDTDPGSIPAQQPVEASEEATLKAPEGSVREDQDLLNEQAADAAERDSAEPTTLLDEAQQQAADIRAAMERAHAAQQGQQEGDEPEPERPVDDEVEQIVQTVLASENLTGDLEKLNVDKLRRVGTRLGVTTRGLLRDDLLREVFLKVELFRKQLAESAQEQQLDEPVPAAEDFSPSTAEDEAHLPFADTTLLERVKAAIALLEDEHPDAAGWSEAEVVARANEIWSVNVTTLDELPDEYLDKIWSAVPQEVQEAVA